MSPVVGTGTVRVTLTGTDFGNNGQLSSCGPYKVKVKRGPGDWISIPVISWSDSSIEWGFRALPAWGFEPYRRYKVKVTTPTGTSNLRKFYVLPGPEVDRMEDDTGNDAHGPVGRWLKIFSTVNRTFSGAREKWYEDPLGGTCPDYFGAIYVVTFTSSSGRYCATEYKNWNYSGNNDSFEVKLDNLWEDSDGDYYQDGGEPTGAPISFGSYSVQVCLIIYGDSNGNGGFSGDDDTVYQVVKSQQGIIYEVTGNPWITQLIPTSTPPSRPGDGKKVIVMGFNFGPTQGTSILHIGGKSWSVGHPKINIWQDHKIKFKVPAYEAPFPKYKDVWVTVNGIDSNKAQLEITAP
jgi:hypothetical protein